MSSNGFIPTDADINPFEDIVCEAKINPGYGCHQKIKYRFVAKESSGKEIAIKDWSQMAYKGIDTATGLSNYIGPLSGWKDGWTDEDTLDYIIKIIKRDGGSNTIKCEVRVEDELANVKNEKFFPVSLCLKLWGDRNAPHTTNFMRGESTILTARSLVGKTLSIVNEGFNQIDPFKTYQEKFFHSLELNKKDDSGIALPTDDQCLFNNLRIVTASATECGAKELNYLFTEKGATKYAGGYTSLGRDAILLNPEPIAINPESIADSKIIPLPILVIHETGHAFCYLDDEYIANNRDTCVVSGQTNCRNDPDSYGIYGDTTHFGCTYDQLFGNSLWRPSYKSIMRTTDVGRNGFTWSTKRFNVISCGYCLKMIKSNAYSFADADLKPYFDECMGLDTVKPSKACETPIDCPSWQTCERITINNNDLGRCI